MEDEGFNDSLYWYNERANISALAGAAWRCSGYALEEFSNEKGDGEDKAMGRVDLYLSIGDSDAAIEAKLIWIRLGPNKKSDLVKAIDAAHRKAMGDIQRTMKQEPAGQGLGLTFIVPYWKHEDYKNNSEIIGSQLNKIKEYLEEKRSIYAWIENVSGLDLKNESGWVYNSVFLAADPCKS